MLTSSRSRADYGRHDRRRGGRRLHRQGRLDLSLVPCCVAHIVTRTLLLTVVGASAVAVYGYELLDVRGGEFGWNATRVFVSYAILFAVVVLVCTRGQRPRLALLMLAEAVAAALADIWSLFPDSVAVITIVTPFTYVYAALYVHMVLAYPTGYLRDRLDRIGVIASYATCLAAAMAILMSWDPRGCADCTPSVSSPILIEGASWPLWLNVGKALLMLNGLAFIALIARRVVRAPAGARRSLWPLGVAAFLATAQFVVRRGAEVAEQWSWMPVFDWTDSISMLAVPIALGAGVLLSQRASRRVADLVVDLGSAKPGHVEEALATAVGDPSLTLALWDARHGRWISPEGRRVELPSEPSRAVTIVGSGLAAIVHDPDLIDQRQLLATAGSAARLALENERLHAELRAQVEELKASRARIVTAGDEERRRLERDLHDGAQQRLLGVGLALQLLRPRLGAKDEAEPMLAEAEDELRSALAELRELARGIHPAVLTEQGLPRALRSLAGRSPMPISVEIERDVDEAALSSAVQAVLYFVAAEALDQCCKALRCHPSLRSRSRGGTGTQPSRCGTTDAVERALERDQASSDSPTALARSVDTSSSTAHRGPEPGSSWRFRARSGGRRLRHRPRRARPPARGPGHRRVRRRVGRLGRALPSCAPSGPTSSSWTSGCRPRTPTRGSRRPKRSGSHIPRPACSCCRSTWISATRSDSWTVSTCGPATCSRTGSRTWTCSPTRSGASSQARTSSTAI